MVTGAATSPRQGCVFPVRLHAQRYRAIKGVAASHHRRRPRSGHREDLQCALKRLEKIFQAEEGTSQADERDVLVTLIEGYEARHYDFGPANSLEAIKFRMEQEGLTPRDVEPYIGQSGRVSEVLKRKRALSLRMVKRLHDGLRIPYESLLAGVR